MSYPSKAAQISAANARAVGRTDYLQSDTGHRRIRFGFLEDDTSDANKIQSTLDSRIFTPVMYRNFKQANIIKEASEFDIFSLDVDINNDVNKSKRMARELRENHPFLSVLFFTLNPKEVQDEAVHFILEKKPSVWEAYDRLVLMIWIHDKCLALLKATNDYAHNQEKEPFRDTFNEKMEELKRFYPSLQDIIEFARENDPALAERYGKLKSTLHRILFEVNYQDEILTKLTAVRRPLLEAVLDERQYIKQIDGVHISTTLESEIGSLKESVAEEQIILLPRLSYGRKDRLKDSVKVFALESLAKSLTGILGLLTSTRPATTGQTEEQDAIREMTVEEGIPESAPMTGNVADPAMAEDDASVLYLNASFPNRQKEGWLVAGIQELLLINFSYTSELNAVGVSDAIPPEVESQIETVEYIDIVVLCPGADVVPLRNRLKMPPHDDKPARFYVTPGEPKIYTLSVILMVKNEPIYRTAFSFEARPKDVSTGATENRGPHVDDKSRISD